MTPSEVAKKIEMLRESLRRHDYLYYVEGRPRISDAAYDKIFRELVALESAHPEFDDPNSPTRKVGAPPREGFSKVAHLGPMLSLDSSDDTARVEKFFQQIRDELARRQKKPEPSDLPPSRVDGWIASAASGKLRYALEPKFDGISVEAVFERGEFVRAVTRGDGQVGEDVTENIRTVRSLPLKLQPAARAISQLAVRGEVVMLKSAFHAMNRDLVERGQDPFANPRNATSGAVRQLDPSVTATRPLDVVFYDILAIEGAPIPTTHEATLDWMRQAGLPIPTERACVTDPEGVLAFHADLLDHRDAIDVDMDGIVIKVDDIGLHGFLGLRDRSPRAAFALKFPPRSETTRVADIAVQVGRTGALTPVALLEPVDVGGVTVSRASLHNADIVRKLDVRLGDRVLVRRAGDVIPEIASVDPSARADDPPPFEMPTSCPACGTPVVRDGAIVRCPAGMACPAQLKEALRHWASRGAADIESLGKKKVEQILDAGLIRTVPDLYRLTPADLETLPGWGVKSATKLVDALDATRHMPADRFIFALGIRHVGERVARLLVEAFPSLDALASADVGALQAIDEIGPEIAGSVRAFFSESRNLDLLGELNTLGVDPDWPVATLTDASDSDDPIAGKKFVFTGALSKMSRSQARQLVERQGGRISGSVSKKTDYVVVGTDPGSKADKARTLGVTLLDEDAFVAMVEREGDKGEG